MKILELLNQIDDLVLEAKSVPGTKLKLVHSEQLYSIIDQIRADLPGEIRQTRQVVEGYKGAGAEFNSETERAVKEAREHFS